MQDKTKRFISMMLSLLMVVMMIPMSAVPVFAEDQQPTIELGGVSLIDNGIIKEGNEYKLTENIIVRSLSYAAAYAEGVVISGDCTIDLNGYEICFSYFTGDSNEYGNLITVSTGSVTIKNSSDAGCIRFNRYSKNTGTAIEINSNAELIINDVYIKSTHYSEGPLFDVDTNARLTLIGNGKYSIIDNTFCLFNNKGTITADGYKLVSSITYDSDYDYEGLSIVNETGASIELSDSTVHGCEILNYGDLTLNNTYLYSLGINCNETPGIHDFNVRGNIETSIDNYGTITASGDTRFNDIITEYMGGIIMENGSSLDASGLKAMSIDFPAMIVTLKDYNNMTAGATVINSAAEDVELSLRTMIEAGTAREQKIVKLDNNKLYFVSAASVYTGEGISVLNVYAGLEDDIVNTKTNDGKLILEIEGIRGDQFKRFTQIYNLFNTMIQNFLSEEGDLETGEKYYDDYIVSIIDTQLEEDIYDKDDFESLIWLKEFGNITSIKEYAENYATLAMTYVNSIEELSLFGLESYSFRSQTEDDPNNYSMVFDKTIIDNVKYGDGIEYDLGDIEQLYFAVKAISDGGIVERLVKTDNENRVTTSCIYNIDSYHTVQSVKDINEAVSKIEDHEGLGIALVSLSGLCYEISGAALVTAAAYETSWAGIVTKEEFDTQVAIYNASENVTGSAISFYDRYDASAERAAALISKSTDEGKQIVDALCKFLKKGTIINSEATATSSTITLLRGISASIELPEDQVSGKVTLAIDLDDTLTSVFYLVNDLYTFIYDSPVKGYLETILNYPTPDAIYMIGDYIPMVKGYLLNEKGELKTYEEVATTLAALADTLLDSMLETNDLHKISEQYLDVDIVPEGFDVKDLLMSGDGILELLFNAVDNLGTILDKLGMSGMLAPGEGGLEILANMMNSGLARVSSGSGLDIELGDFAKSFEDLQNSYGVYEIAVAGNAITPLVNGFDIVGTINTVLSNASVSTSAILDKVSDAALGRISIGSTRINLFDKNEPEDIEALQTILDTIENILEVKDINAILSTYGYEIGTVRLGNVVVLPDKDGNGPEVIACTKGDDDSYTVTLRGFEGLAEYGSTPWAIGPNHTYTSPALTVTYANGSTLTGSNTVKDFTFTVPKGTYKAQFSVVIDGTRYYSGITTINVPSVVTESLDFTQLRYLDESYYNGDFGITFDSSSKTLTLDNVTVNAPAKNDFAIKVPAGTTIVVIGENTITKTGNGKNNAYGILCEGDLVISDGALDNDNDILKVFGGNGSDEAYGISAAGIVTIGCPVDINGGTVEAKRDVLGKLNSDGIGAAQTILDDGTNQLDITDMVEGYNRVYARGYAVTEDKELTAGAFSFDPSNATVFGKNIKYDSDRTFTICNALKPSAPAVAAKAQSDVATNEEIAPEKETAAAVVAEALATGASVTDIYGEGITEITTEKLSGNEYTAENVSPEAISGCAATTDIAIVYQTYAKVTVTDVEGTETTTESITVDIQPMLIRVATTKEVAAQAKTSADAIKTTGEGVNAVVLGSPEALDVKKTVTVTIPLPETFVKENGQKYANGESILIQHDKTNASGEAINTYFYVGYISTEGGLYLVSFENPNGFSSFKIGASTGDIAAYKDGVGYKTFKEAVDAVKDGETIILNKNASGISPVAVSEAKTFYVNAKTYTYEPELITNGSGYDRSCSTEGDITTYVFSVHHEYTYSPSYYDIKIADTILNGTVSADASSAYAGKTVTLTAAPAAYYKLSKLSVKLASGKEVALKTVEEGKTYTFSMPSGKVTVDAEFELDNWTNPFVDVTEGSWYMSSLEWACRKGIIDGIDETHFSPSTSTTRAQMVTVLWRAAGCPEPKSTVSEFTDVTAASYYEKAVIWAAENGIVNGVTETTFCPRMNVTRGQIVTMLYRYFGSEDVNGLENKFTDVKAERYYTDAVLWAANEGIVNGKTETTFEPASDCLRRELVALLYRSFAE